MSDFQIIGIIAVFTPIVVAIIIQFRDEFNETKENNREYQERISKQAGKDDKRN